MRKAALRCVVGPHGREGQAVRLDAFALPDLLKAHLRRHAAVKKLRPRTDQRFAHKAVAVDGQHGQMRKPRRDHRALGFRAGIRGARRLLPPGERLDRQVVGVRMGDEQVPDARQAHAEPRGGVKAAGVHVQQGVRIDHRSGVHAEVAAAMGAGVGAIFAIAPDGGIALARRGAQKGDLHLHTSEMTPASRFMPS